MYRLSLVGQAIDADDFSAAGSILGGGASSDWVKNANVAFAKVGGGCFSVFLGWIWGFRFLREPILIQSCYFVLSRAVLQLSISSEEKGEVDAFNSSLGSLIASGELVGVSYEDHRQFKPCDSLWLSVYSLFTVANKDAETSKEAFVTSAGALEKWVILTGLAGKITGL